MTLTQADTMLLHAAYAQALKSRSEGGIPIGAALGTTAGVVLAVGHNRRVQTGDSTAHAETVCIRSAGRRRDWNQLVLATTLSPCAMCSGAAVLHGIHRVVIGENETFKGREDWLLSAGIEVVIAQDARCRQLMSHFVRSEPDLWNEDIGQPPE